MNLEDLTIKQARELAAMFGGNQPARTNIASPLIGKYCTAAMLARGVSTDPEHPDRIALDKARAALSRAKEQM